MCIDAKSDCKYMRSNVNGVIKIKELAIRMPYNTSLFCSVEFPTSKLNPSVLAAAMNFTSMSSKYATH